MPKTKSQKYYTVRKGKEIGVFDSREDCKKSVQGFSGAQYKSFDRKNIAEQAFKMPYEEFITHKTKINIFDETVPFERNSIAVDAACSGNPGLMEYRGVDLQKGGEIFREKFELGTNNIGEFLAIVHGLSYLQQKNLKDTAIYTDSKTAMDRVKQKKCKSLLKKSKQTQKLFEIIKRAENWLKTNSYENKIIKRDTETRGEIPADFGRK